ncbi:hypothetical protein HY624_03660 [Candidatus Uhrbacteria bacterium]|nr:hypothetical protein [Candidatus Uhrbacteria bacterium]
MRRFVIVLLGGLFTLALCTCANPRMTGGLTDASVAELDQRMHGVLNKYFDPAIVPSLKQIRVNYIRNLHAPFTGEKVDGYYNPLTNSLTLDPMIGESSTVHEFVHVAWFQHLSLWTTLRFRMVMTSVAADPKHKAFTTRVRTGLDRNHWLNNLFARTTETYSDISEIMIKEEAPESVPDEVKAFYRGVLKERPSPDHEEQEAPPDSQ